MTVFSSIVYGIIQGIAEFLPISSSGHLALAQNFGLFDNSHGSNIAFNVFLHLGTLAAVCIVYKKDILLLIKSFFVILKRIIKLDFKTPLEEGEKLFLLLCAASIPLVPAALLEDKIEWLSGSSKAIGVFLILNGVMLRFSEKLSNGKYNLSTAKISNAMSAGLFQLFGVLPGISRSGATITGGLLGGFDRESALRFSFLMSVPAVLGASIFELKDIAGSFDPQMITVSLTGAVTAAIVGAASIKLLQYLARDKSFLPFTVYCVIVGSVSLIYDFLK